MSSATSYSRCPIVEALLDIQVELPESTAPSNLLKCQKKVKAAYPTVQEKHLRTLEIEQSQSASSSSQKTQCLGYGFQSPDKTQMFQARIDGFTFNRMAPYPGWASFLSEAKRLWEEYRRVARPLEYKRVAVRYINVINFPKDLPAVELSDYFTTQPNIPPDLPQHMGSFFYRVELPLTEIEAVVGITQAPTPNQDSVSILLDIDLFRVTNIKGESLWSLFEQFRIWKNKVFEACITNRLREMIR